MRIQASTAVFPAPAPNTEMPLDRIVEVRSPAPEPTDATSNQQSRTGLGARDKSQGQPNADQLEHVVAAMNQAVVIFNRTLQFEIAKDKRVVIRVIDTETGEVVRQIPPESLIEAFHRIDAALGGVLIDRKV